MLETEPSGVRWFYCRDAHVDDRLGTGRAVQPVEERVTANSDGTSRRCCSAAQEQRCGDRGRMVIGFELGPSATLPSSNCPVILLPGWAKSSVSGLSVEVNIAPRAVEALRRPGAPSEQGVQPMTTVTNSRIGI